MASYKSFEELEVWQRARTQCTNIYAITSEGRFDKDFALKDQMRRSALSVVSNIAEGFERETDKEFSRFLTIAKASCGELRAQLYIAFDLNYMDHKKFTMLKNEATEISRMLQRFIKYLKRENGITQKDF